MNSFAQQDFDQLEAERDLAYGLSIEDIDPSDRRLYQENVFPPYLERLRNESPIHYHSHSRVGPFWSITRYDDIRKIDINHHQFSSEPSVTFVDSEGSTTNNFISMDKPKHEIQRKAVAPATGPRNLAQLESLIRKRAINIIEELPEKEEFNWVERVSVELTTQMLVTLFDFPFAERSKSTRWSDVATASTDSGVVTSPEARLRELDECFAYFMNLWNERAQNPVGNDLISMLLRNENTRDMPEEEFYGNLLLLIVGGNDTTRNSISGGLLALNLFQDQFSRLKKDRGLIEKLVPEVIRWQTPIIYMRRTALEDVEFQGQWIREGDKVVMWYISGNRDSETFVNPQTLDLDRHNIRSHLSFGFGIHRCMGNRLAEMQLRIVWEELLKRVDDIAISGSVVRNRSNLIRGYKEIPVVIKRKKQ